MKKNSKGIICCLVSVLFVIVAGTVFAASSTYKISPGDSLEISVWKDQSLTRTLVVPPDGFISFPLIKDLDVSNLTVPELRDIVTKKLAAYVPDANVTVILLQTPSMTAYVMGKVNKPGQFPITTETTVLQILAMAGDLNPYAAGSKIFVLRHEKGKSTKIPFDYNEVKRFERLEQNIYLKRGDVVVVP
ncbi:polysaccharide biosynthesis/export family protein [Syntrophus aciditrophicus]|uniref:Periplasmic protein involved in polysaccharide export n=1 Tax=Syntrophus aciditrophicus (strain SB) TaxID=56780 RepID=Q2LVS7_SYNAS|nr:polysaccharide biosynthesis/export family protein [Syntrophus aciditrophicus]ABC78191.1 periplasmic protein involved in polysaccharide export [Syntrophus aciditrophicus SB]